MRITANPLAYVFKADDDAVLLWRSGRTPRSVLGQDLEDLRAAHPDRNVRVHGLTAIDCTAYIEDKQ